MSCGVGLRLGLDLVLLWLWCRQAAVAPIRPLAWEPPYAAGEALRKQKKKKKKKEKKSDFLTVPLLLTLHRIMQRKQFFYPSSFLPSSPPHQIRSFQARDQIQATVVICATLVATLGP